MNDAANCGSDLTSPRPRRRAVIIRTDYFHSHNYTDEFLLNNDYDQAVSLRSIRHVTTSERSPHVRSSNVSDSKATQKRCGSPTQLEAGRRSN